MKEKIKRRGTYRIHAVFLCFIELLQFVFWADLDTDSANAPSADILKMLLHIARAFFRVEISVSVRRRLFPENRARRAGFLTERTISAAVFDNRLFRRQGQGAKHCCQTDLAAVFFG